jgi:membrane-associated phospholipid phosphatase
LELAYLSVYLLVPLGFALAMAVAPALDVDRYWTIVVAAELGAYALLPWIQTRTPRTLGDHTAIDGRGLIVRRLNLAIGRGASIRVNTMPSGHAAGATAIALAVFEVSPAAGAGVFAVAAAIVAGSVIGRYHFAIDGLLGVLLAYRLGAGLTPVRFLVPTPAAPASRLDDETASVAAHARLRDVIDI